LLHIPRCFIDQRVNRVTWFVTLEVQQQTGDMGDCVVPVSSLFQVDRWARINLKRVDPNRD